MTEHPRGRYLEAVAQIRVPEEGHPEGVIWASLPLYENSVDLAVTWIRANHETLRAQMLAKENDDVDK